MRWGNRRCRECNGLGDTISDARRGEGTDCQHCHGEGRYVCPPCDASSGRPRCNGQGEMEES